MKNGTITMTDGRIVGYADYGSPSETAVVWCHGGPGSRLEPAFYADAVSIAASEGILSYRTSVQCSRSRRK
jgi:hypothetical protein